MARIDAAPISYGGGMLSYGVQADLITPAAAMRELRYNSIDAFPTNEFERKAQSNLGHQNDAEFTARGILHRAHKPDALQITVPITCGDDRTQTPPIMDFLAAGGWEIMGAGTASTIAVYTSPTDFTITADVLGIGAQTVHGVTILVSLTDGRLWPCLLRTYEGATGACTPAMGLPAATLAGRAVHGMWTAAPLIRPVPAAKLLSFQVRTRAATYDYTGCALSSAGELVMAPNGDMSMQFTFHVGKVDVSGESLAAEDFAMSLVENLWSCSQFQIADADDVAAIANAELMVQRATWRQMYTTKPQPGIGACDDVLADIQGYIVDRPGQVDDGSQAECEMSAIFDDDRRTEWQDRDEFFLAAAHPISALGQPAVVVAIPAAYYLAEPDDQSDDTEAGAITQTVRFGGRSARWFPGGPTDETNRGNRDFYLAIGGAVAP